ncbi:hypothetical protein CSX04_05344 [Burkholderia cepacia]|nr:hypothetical protein CSX04_05344 [Burkholderia cepacia]
MIYTSSTKKDEEHGGNAPDDSHLGLLVSYPGLHRARTVTDTVGTKQVAPTILGLLGADPRLLHAVVAENTGVLPGLGIGR